MTATIPVKAPDCATCNDYEYVPGKGGMLAPCPDCGREVVRCPLHDERVMTRGGVVLGRCWKCANEAAQGLAWMAGHPYKANGGTRDHIH